MSTVAAVEPRWLIDVRLRSLRRVLWCRAVWAGHRYSGEDRMAITHSEVEHALAPAERRLSAEREFYEADEDARLITAEIEQLDDAHADPLWDRLCSELGLAPDEAALLSLALAAEVNPALRRVYGYLNDEVAAIDPTPALAADLWGWSAPPRLGVDSALVYWALARPVGLEREAESSANGWLADPLVLDQLLADRPARTSGLFGRPIEIPAGVLLYERELEEIARFVEALSDDGEQSLPIEVELVAPPGSGKTTLAARVARRLGRPLVAVDSRAIAARADPIASAIREVRHARLCDSLLVWQHAEDLPAAALDAVRRRSGLVFLTTSTRLPAAAAGVPVRRSYVLAPLNRTERLRLWSTGSHAEAPEPVAEWALRAAEVLTATRIAGAGDAALRDVCRLLLLDAPPDLLSPLPLVYTWDDLVVSPQLDAHLREFEAQARMRGEVLDGWGLRRLAPLGGGVTALFAGPSGTGKTMAVQVLARSLGLELYRVDLAGVVNKYIGETEKHLRSLFAACERGPVLLFFDEADALFGRRTQVSDAHDRFANIEIDYLLQLMEQFDGVAVLATNRKGDLDPAFMRRLRFTIDFAPPTVDERERLWRLALDKATDSDGRSLVGPIDWRTLAQQLDLTGAGIKASALGAAFLARTNGTPIATPHLVAAARRELEKQGVVVRAGQLG